ncbi:MAG: LemA family protein [Erysipelotrichaceae bacterium]
MNIVLIVIVVIIVLILIWAIGVYNSFMTLKNKIEEAFSTMDVYLKKRYDLIPNLVETVKGYAKHESETLENVINARNKAVNATSTSEKIQANAQISTLMPAINALSEAYPDLKANENFLALQKDLSTIEGEITNARKYYNAVVNKFNTNCDIFPSVIIANMMHLEKRVLFEVSNETERENVQVKF